MRMLKMLSVTLLAAAVLAAIAVLPSRLCFKGAESYAFFTGDGSRNFGEVRATDDAAAKRLALIKLNGECAEYSSLDLDGLLREVNGEVVFVEELSDSVNYYCKADLPYSVSLYGEEINLHVSFRENGVKIASPIIFGGY